VECYITSIPIPRALAMASSGRIWANTDDGRSLALIPISGAKNESRKLFWLFLAKNLERTNDLLHVAAPGFVLEGLTLQYRAASGQMKDGDAPHSGGFL
jgi:hypothetical protein